MTASLLRGQSLTLALVVAVSAALLYPPLGSHDGPLHPESSTKLAVFLIFLMQGLSLPTRHLLKSSAHFRLHLFSQLCIFVASPLLMLGIASLSMSWTPSEIHIGFFYLSFVPTTITSAIVLTSNSSGNTAAALFSSTLSNILGIFITPFLCIQIIATGNDHTLDPGPLIAKLALLILLPLLLGQALRQTNRQLFDTIKPRFKPIGNGLIVFIVYTVYCESAQQRVFQDAGLLSVVSAAAGAILFLLLLSCIVWLTTPLASSSYSDRIAAFFCGSQKSLATGAPMAALIFSYAPDAHLGLILLPLLIHHPLQLVMGGLLSPGFSRLASNRT